MDVGPYRHQTSSAGPYRKSRQLKNILTNLDHIATRSHILTHWTPTPPSSGMELRDEKSCDSSSPYGKESTGSLSIVIRPSSRCPSILWGIDGWQSCMPPSSNRDMRSVKPIGQPEFSSYRLLKSRMPSMTYVCHTMPPKDGS